MALCPRQKLWAAFGLSLAGLLFFHPEFLFLARTPMEAAAGSLQDPWPTYLELIPGHRVFRRELLDHGNLLWSGLRALGMPILAGGAVSAPLFPLTWAGLWLPEETYWNFLVCSRLVLMGMAALLLAERHLRLRKPAAAVFALNLTYCFYVLRWMNHPVQTAWMAGLWYVLMTLEAVRLPVGASARRKAATVLGLSVSAFGLATCGFPETALAGAILSLLAALIHAPPVRDLGRLRRIGGRLALGNAIGLALAAPQFLALSEMVSLARPGYRAGPVWGRLPVHLDSLLSLLTPSIRPPLDPHFLFQHYFGLIPAFLFFRGFLRGLLRARRLPVHRGDLLAAAAGLAYLMKAVPLGEWIPEAFSRIQFLRATHFELYCVPLFLWFFAHFAARGSSAWPGGRRPAGQGRIDLVAAGLVLAWLICAAGFGAGAIPWDTLRSGPVVAVLTAFAVFLALVAWPRGRQAWRPALAAVAMLCLGLELRITGPGDFAPELSKPTRSGIPTGPAPWESRVWEQAPTFRLAAGGFGTFLDQGVATPDFGAGGVLTERMQQLRESLFKVDWEGYLPIQGPLLPYSWQAISVNGIYPVPADRRSPAGAPVLETLPALPRAYLADRCRPVSGRAEAQDSLTDPMSFRPGLALLEGLSAEEAVLCRAIAAPSVQAAEIGEDRGSRLRLRRVRGPGVLVLNDSVYPGWNARDLLSDRSLPVRTANLAFRAVLLPEARDYLVEFRYLPPWWGLASLLMGAGALGALVLAWLCLRAPRFALQAPILAALLAGGFACGTAPRPPPPTAPALEIQPVPRPTLGKARAWRTRKHGQNARASALIQSCSQPEARAAFLEGFGLQQSRKSEEALKAFTRCLQAEPACVDCLYESGWAYFSANRFALAARQWEAVLKINPQHPGAREYLPQAQARLHEPESGKPAAARPRHPAIGTRSRPADSPLSLTLVARFQSFDSGAEHPLEPGDRYDTEIESPKSARFSRDGRKVYVNSLEASKTVIYDARSLEKRKSISHIFSESDSGLFRESEPFDYAYDDDLAEHNPNVFSGKPVESELTHRGRFLWVPYYRRSFDHFGTNPSAVAVIDTRQDRIVRVMATGPIAKYAAASPDGRYLAISHWGDNTLSLIDIRGQDPAKFKYRAHLVVEKPLDLDTIGEVNRDKECGFCIRGLAYTPDGRYLLVARMGGSGGIAIFDLRAKGEPAYLGTLMGMRPKPRDILVSRDGKWLYVSSTLSGYVSRLRIRKLVATLKARPRGATGVIRAGKFEEAFVGMGPRSIRLSPNGRFLFAAVNGSARIVAVDWTTRKVVARIEADPYPVGLAVSPDGRQIWVTAQGRAGAGGNSVMVYQVKYGRR